MTQGEDRFGEALGLALRGRLRGWLHRGRSGRHRDLARKEKQTEQNREALTQLVGPLTAAFDLTDGFIDSVFEAQGWVVPASFPIADRLEDIDHVWRSEVSRLVGDDAVYQAYANADLPAKATWWRGLVENQTPVNALGDAAVDVRNAIVQIMRSLEKARPADREG